VMTQHSTTLSCNAANCESEVAWADVTFSFIGAWSVGT
jgi:hypothetical protein